VSEAVDTLDKDSGGKAGVGEFIKETRAEMKKVTYPSSEDVRGTTLIVVLNVIFFAIFLFLIDKGWTYVLQAIEWVVNKIAGL
jgi:preprotein translocase SecE subunit